MWITSKINLEKRIVQVPFQSGKLSLETSCKVKDAAARIPQEAVLLVDTDTALKIYEGQAWEAGKTRLGE